MNVVLFWDAVFDDIHGLEMPEGVEMLEQLCDSVVALAPASQHCVRRRTVAVDGQTKPIELLERRQK